MISARVLSTAEWPKLQQTGCDLIPVKAAAERGSVIVVEDDDGQIVATGVLFTALHWDGVWVREDHRGTAGVGRCLLDALRDGTKAFNVQGVICSATNPDVSAWIERLGGEKLPGELLMLPMEKPDAHGAERPSSNGNH